MTTDEPKKSPPVSADAQAEVAWLLSELEFAGGFRDLLKTILVNEFLGSRVALAVVLACAATGGLSIGLEHNILSGALINRDIVDYAGSWASQLLGILLAGFAIFAGIASSESGRAISLTKNKKTQRSLAREIGLSFVGAAMPMLVACAMQAVAKVALPRGGYVAHVLLGLGPVAFRTFTALSAAFASAVLAWMFLALKDLILNIFRTFLVMLALNFAAHKADWIAEIERRILRAAAKKRRDEKAREDGNRDKTDVRIARDLEVPAAEQGQAGGETDSPKKANA